MSWMNWDITFCPDEKCIHEDCERHPKNHPVGVPFSRFVESPRTDVYKCPEYLPKDEK